MFNQLPAFRFGARLSLMLAALLYVVGGAAEPRLHTHVTAAAPLSVIEAADDPGGMPPPQEDRLCFACQVLGAVGLPAIGASLPEAPLSFVSARQDLDAGLPSSRVAPTRARDPPLA